MNNEQESCHALLITAHCDDSELWAGGTIAKWSEKGLKTTVAVFHHSTERRLETNAAASILNFEPLFKDSDSAPHEWISELLNNRAPQILLTHPGYDPHPEHEKVNKAVIRAMSKHTNRREFPLRWYFFDTYYLSRSPTTFPLLVDISDAWGRKAQALSKHLSQNPENLINMAQHTNALLGMRARCNYAEAFYPFDILGRWPQLRELP